MKHVWLNTTGIPLKKAVKIRLDNPVSVQPGQHLGFSTNFTGGPLAFAVDEVDMTLTTMY